VDQKAAVGAKASAAPFFALGIKQLFALHERRLDVDLGAASDQIDALIEKRSRQRSEANAVEELWRASVRRHNARVRRQHRAEWFTYFSNLAAALRASAEEFDRKAEALLEETDRGEGAS
jgi:hypothetical protein